MYKEGAIKIKEVKGRKKVWKRKLRRGPGKIRRTVVRRKQKYVKLSRKLRRYVAEMKNHGKINDSDVGKIRIKIKDKAFKSRSHLKEQLNLTETK